MYWATHSPSSIQEESTLGAGDEERFIVHPSIIIHCHDGPPLKSGRYYFQAVYDHGGGFTRSERIPVEVTADDVFVLGH